MALPIVRVNSRGRARIASGHPWVYRQDVIEGPTNDARSGGPALVEVLDGRRPLALCTWAVQSPVALRVLARESIDVPDLLPLVQDRVRAARARRLALQLDRDAVRVVHGESDALPGLFVDQYADVAVVQTTSVAMDALRPRLVDWLRAELRVRMVIAREDGSARDFEGLTRLREIAAGEGPTLVEYRLGENRLLADLMTDSKTGGFLDQADNHAFVASLAPAGARCYDGFTYHGGFALALARRGGPVLATDEDANAASRARANAERNGLSNMEARQANAFDLLRSLEAGRERFDVVVLDPPAFAKRKGGDGAADRAYKEVMLRGLRLTEPGGLAVLCSCSGRVSRDHFDELVAEAAADSGRLVQILDRRGAGRDHPELVGVPETGHLKVWVLRVL